MTKSHSIHAAANRHFKAVGSQPVSTFQAVTAAAQATRAKTDLLRRTRMDREDAAAAIQLPDLSRRNAT